LDGDVKNLSIQGLAKTFTTLSGEVVEAVLPIYLDIAPGEFVTLVGPSGCGKSTILNMLAGFVKPSAGIAKVGNELIMKPDIDHGMVFQDYALFPWLSVIQNVEFGLVNKGITKKDRRTIAFKYLQTVGLEGFANKRPQELSGGMKQRVAIARAFATEPSIILMDEPFGALDALTRRFLQNELLRIWQEHKKTIVFVTHLVGEAVYLSDRIVVMTARPGQIKEIIHIDIPYPRAIRSNEFRNYERHIFDQLDEELAKSINLEGYSLTHEII
jgi:ABC-type nitrate/sulfonate/bicarbonate transport system ATPase subunit